MKNILGVLLMAGSIFYFSCGDPSERAGREAGEEHNQNTTGGTTGGYFEMEEDTSAGGGMETDTTAGGGIMEGDTTASGSLGGDTTASGNTADTTATSKGNFQPRQKGGSTPADGEGNY